MPTTQKNLKEAKRTTLLRHASLPKMTRAIILSYIGDEEIQKFLQTACDTLDITLISGSEIRDSVYTEGADAFIADVSVDTLPIGSLMREQVVPILPLWCEKSLSEFNPMKFEGNAFLFEQTTGFHILEKIIRYLENIRYPGDKRMLLENVGKTKI
jgi:hypothetical protein